MVLRLVQFAGEPRYLGFLTEAEELLLGTAFLGVFALRLRAVATLRLALEHRRIAHPKAGPTPIAAYIKKSLRRQTEQSSGASAIRP